MFDERDIGQLSIGIPLLVDKNDLTGEKFGASNTEKDLSNQQDGTIESSNGNDR